MQIRMWMFDRFFTFLNTGRHYFLRYIVTHQGAMLQRPYNIRYGILYHIYSIATGRHCKGLGGVCSIWAQSRYFWSTAADTVPVLTASAPMRTCEHRRICVRHCRHAGHALL